MNSFIKTLASSGLLLISMTASRSSRSFPSIRELPGIGRLDAQEATTTTEKGPMVRNIVKPTITAYFPDKGKANGTAIVIAPGGGYHYLAVESEGSKLAEWLRDRGVAAFVLKYRTAKMPASDEEFREYRQKANSGAQSKPH